MKKFYLLLTAGLLLFIVQLSAQNRTIDSLNGLLVKHPQSDTIRVNLLNELGNRLLDFDPEKSLKSSKQALKLSREINFVPGEIKALRRMGSYYYQVGDYAAALKSYDSSGQVASKFGDSNALAWSLNGRGTVFHSQSDYPQALQFYLQSVQLFEKIGRQNEAASIMSNVGVLYKEMGELSQALSFYERGLRIHEPQGHKYETSLFLNNIGGIYLEQRKFAQAEETFMHALPIAEEVANTHLIALILRNLANVKDAQQNYKQAISYGFRSLSLFESLDETEAIADVYYQIADTYLNTKKTDSSLFYANKALVVAQKIGFNRNIYNTYKVLALAYAQKKNYPKAFEAQSLYIDYKDSLVGEDKQNLVAGLKFQYDLDKKQSEIVLLTKEKELQAEAANHQRQKIYALLIGLLLAGLLAGALIVNNRQKQKANILLEQQKAEIDGQANRLQQLNNELKGANQQLFEQTKTVTAQRDYLEETLKELKSTQAQLVQREKMASLGELTAGIAHEIQNPLNFVNNFSEISAELIDEMGKEFSEGNREEGILLASNIKQNLEKIVHHGKRADAIVKGMLQHSRSGHGQKEPTDINALADEYLKLSYHVQRAKDKTFNIAIHTHFDYSLGKINIVPQDIGRVFLNLYNNAFYSIAEKKKSLTTSYEPSLSVTTKKLTDQVEIRVKDNGVGIPQKILDKIFHPFFTTKPTGKGTGLGLSLSYDIITKGHGGNCTVNTVEGEYAEFVITLPVK